MSIRSSYIANNYGELLRQYVIAFQTSSFVELGVLDGYSTLHIAEGVKWLHKYRNYETKLDAYDLFDDYEYKHGSFDEVSNMLYEKNVSQYVNLQQGDAYKVHENYPDIEIDEAGDPCKGIEFLHIDISNTGKVIHDLMELWHPKIGYRGVILIEGGSEERDNVAWMKMYKSPSIKDEIASNSIINKYYMYGTYFQFPSITMLFRKWRKGQYR